MNKLVLAALVAGKYAAADVVYNALDGRFDKDESRTCCATIVSCCLNGELLPFLVSLILILQTLVVMLSQIAKSWSLLQDPHPSLLLLGRCVCSMAPLLQRLLPFALAW